MEPFDGTCDGRSGGHGVPVGSDHISWGSIAENEPAHFCSSTGFTAQELKSPSEACTVPGGISIRMGGLIKHTSAWQ